jgi:hypothetical protein
MAIERHYSINKQRVFTGDPITANRLTAGKRQIKIQKGINRYRSQNPGDMRHAILWDHHNRLLARKYL